VNRNLKFQIALQAYPDPSRVVAPAYKYNSQQLREALAAQVEKYPDGAGYLLEPLHTKTDSSL